MDKREVYIEWDGEKRYLGGVMEICGEKVPGSDSSGPTIVAFIQDVISSLAFATNEDFPETVKIIVR